MLARSVNIMADALARSRGMEQQFLMSVSHDLRTPLTNIRGYAEAIVDEATPPAAGAEVILRESARLERLVRDLLELARLDARQFRLHPVPTDLGAVVTAGAVPGQVDNAGRIAARYRVQDGAFNGLGFGLGVTAASSSQLTLPNSVAVGGYAVADAQATCQVLLAISMESRAAVDAIAGSIANATSKDELVARARKAVGPDGDVMCDCWMSWDEQYTIEMCKLMEPYRVKWVEEVLPAI